MQITSEEDVKVHALPEILDAAGYDTNLISYNHPIPVKQGRKTVTIFADAVVWTDATKTRALLVVETKPPTPLLPGDADQALSYARLLTPIAPFALLTNGSATGTKTYDTFTKNLVTAGLPSPKIALAASKGRSADQDYDLAVEARRELFRVDSVQEYKRILRASHNAIRNNEGYDPTKAFDELSKVMFTKLYEERTGLDRFNVATYDKFLQGKVNLIQTVFKETTQSADFSGLFTGADRIELSDRTIRELVSQFEGYDLSLTDFDVKGEAFEHFLGDTFTGGLGQYFTPRNVVSFMVSAVSPRIGMTVVDPFCGTGGFLIAWHAAVEEKIASADVSNDIKRAWLTALNTTCLYGIDWNERTSLACRMNMTVHGEGQSAANIFKQSGFEDAERSGQTLIGSKMFDVVLTNPPFGSAESDPKIMKSHELGSGRKTIERAALAMERALTLTKPGGMVAIIVMDGILSNDSMRPVRALVRREAHVRALVSLTPETFEGYGGRSNTTVLLLEKKDADGTADDRRTFMAMCRNTGYAANGQEIAGNELPAILTAYRQWRDEDVEPTDANMWVTQVRDRLDPTNYWRPSSSHAPVAVLGTELKSTTDELRATANLLDGLALQIEKLPDGGSYSNHTIGDLLREVGASERLQPQTVYTMVGVRWWGGGAFIREERLGSEISGKKLTQVMPGALIYNRLFAFRASFAVVGPDVDGAYVSAEFPMYEANQTRYDSVELKRYIAHAMNSPAYLPRVDAESSGSTKTSRNRFRQPAFEAFEIALPEDPDELSAVVAVLDTADAVRDRLNGLADLARPLRDRLAGVVRARVE